MNVRDEDEDKGGLFVCVKGLERHVSYCLKTTIYDLLPSHFLQHDNKELVRLTTSFVNHH